MVRKTHPEPGDPAAGNGILSRRIFLEGALVAGATGAGLSRGSAEPLTVQPWMKVQTSEIAPNSNIGVTGFDQNAGATSLPI